MLRWRSPRWWTVGAVLAGAGYTVWRNPGDPVPAGISAEALGWHLFGDGGGFAAAGERLLAGDLAGVYADAWNQAGPVQVLLAALAVRVSSVLGSPALVHFAVAAMMLAGVGWVAGRLVDAVEPALELMRGWWWAAPVAVLLAAYLGVVDSLYAIGHWWQPVVAVGWIAACWVAGRGTVRAALGAGLLVGATTLVEPWGVLGFLPVLLLAAGGWRSRAAAVGAGGAVAGLGWLPFVCSGRFALLDVVWHVDAHSVWSWVVGVDAVFTWQLRVVQVAVMTGLVLAVWWCCRRWVPAVVLGWLLPVLVLLTRVALDPLMLAYYPAAGNLLLVAAVPALLLAARAPVIGVALAWLVTVPVLVRLYGQFWLPRVAVLLVAAGFLAAPARAWRRRQAGSVRGEGGADGGEVVDVLRG